MIDRLPWYEKPSLPRCLARLDNGDWCDLSKHSPTIAHAVQRGEITDRWSVVTWTDRTVEHL